MATDPREIEPQPPTTDAATAPKYEKPALIEYGPLAKITQGQSGSTGEGGNFTMRMCL